MSKRPVFVWLLFFGMAGWTQSNDLLKKALPDTAGKTLNATAFNGTASSAAGSLAQKELLDVLIATNDDCVLLLNNGERKPVSKNSFLYLKLPPGTYRFSAKSPATGDVYLDGFSVEAGKLNEVFIDMLYAIDEEAEKRAAASPEASALGQDAKEGSNQTSGANNKELAAINAIAANMVPVNGGSFVMGNNRSPSADEAEHKVMVHSLLFGKYEVTQQQWESLMGYNPSVNKGCPACPVENVSWEEVMKFIRKLNSLTNKRFRLPTEAEWEYAAKLGGKAEIDKAGGTEEYIKKSAWIFENAESKTHPVGQKQPNTAGIYDLFGNVSEWCADWYGAFFYKEDFTEKNPEGPPLGKDKVFRGGNYRDYAGDRFRPSFRNKMNPKAKAGEIGFRLVLEKQD